MYLRYIRQLWIGTWNVRTICIGMSADLDRTNNIRKIAIIDCEINLLDLDIAALQET